MKFSVLFKTTTKLLIVLSLFIHNTTLSDISKAFPDMSNVFSEVEFRDDEKQFFKYDGYKDKVLLIFFGYTHCPDVCPTTVLDMAKVLKELDSKSNEVQPIFISVDYQRDTQKSVNNYVNFFDKRIAALTSNKENIDILTKHFKTKYDLVDPSKEGYIVEHSSNIYILDKNLQVKKIIPNGIPSNEIANFIKKIL